MFVFPQFNALKHPLKGATDESIVNPIDLNKIKQNIDTYTSFEHFLADIQWIAHNCFILILGKFSHEIRAPFARWMFVTVFEIEESASNAIHFSF